MKLSKVLSKRLFCVMRSVDIGILRAAQIKFDLIGNFSSNVGTCAAKNTVSVENGKLLYKGVSCDELVFAPCGENSSFTLHDVVIGVNFHWQRKESQTFKGALRFIVEEDEVRAINRIDVEEYLVSVISSEMSATSSLEFLKAHAIVIERVVDILRRVTRSQHHSRALDELVTHPHACDARAVGIELEARNLTRKVYLTARRGYR